VDYIIISIYECWIDHHVRCGKIGTSPNEGYKSPPLYRLLKKTMLHMVIRRYAWLSSHLHPLAITHRVAHPHAGKPFVKGGAAQL